MSRVSSSKRSSLQLPAATDAAGVPDASDLPSRLAQIQEAYRRMQTEAASEDQQLQLSVHPGIPGKLVPKAEAALATTAASGVRANGTSAMTAALAYDARRRTLSALTLEMIMTLRMEQIIKLRDSFEQHGGVVSVAQFVAIMAGQLEVDKLQTTPDILLRSLVELFDSMDLDGDGELEFEELLTTVVHMGLAATEHLLLTPIAPYREGPHYLVSMQQVERLVHFIPEREAVLIIDNSGHFAFRLYDPAMKRALAVELPLSSALAVAYVSGVQVDNQQQNTSYRRGTVTKSSYYTSGAPSAKDERAKALKALEAAQAMHQLKQPMKDSSMWDKIAAMPLSKPLRMENGQPMLHQHHSGAAHGKDEDEGGASSAKPASATLISTYTAQPYYGSGSSLHAFTSAAPHSSSGSTIPSAAFSSSSSGGSGSGPASSSGGRTPLVFIHEDFLITSTSQHLQIWDGFPTGPASLCDSKKIRNSYACIRWCPILQKLFCGDVVGNIDVWRIVLLPHAGMAAPPSKPSLVKERELTGHTDIITGLESISSMGFLLSSSLDASVRMYDLQGGVEKNRFIGHRAGVVAIAYSNEYRFLLSAGSDHQVCVWSPFADKVVYSLRGHNAPLIGVQFVPGTPQIVTADADGWMKIWDARNFSCCQTFFTMSSITSFTACSQRHKRIVVVGKSHELCIYEQEGGPFLKRKSEEVIIAAVYSAFTMTILTANKEDVKIWDALTGQLSRVYRGLAESDLTAVCLDSRQRKLFIGDSLGKIRVYNYLTGAYMKSMTPHTEEIISMCYSGSRRLLISATDKTVFVHDERPIEEAVLYMTVTSGEGAEYLVVSVSEPLSSLACAMSNGKIDLWNLDQAMRDVPIAGGHLDVITALYFLDAHQLLLSGDDSGAIMAWFVRPSRWKGQLAFQLFTPPTAKEHSTFARSTTAKKTPLAPNNDPIRLVNGMSDISGISCMQFHAPSSQLFCGHRNGHIIVWNLKPLLDFLARVAADPAANWFVNSTNQHSSMPTAQPTRLQSRIPSASPTRLSVPAAASSSSNAAPGGALHGILHPSAVPLHLLSSGRRSAVQFQEDEVESSLPIKDQLARMAERLKPCNIIQAHESVVTTLHVCASPPALLSATSDHVTHIWSLQGEDMGVLDPVLGLARGYETAAPTGKSPSVSSSDKSAEWCFQVDVESRTAQDRVTTHEVLKSIEGMAIDAQAHQRRQEQEALEAALLKSTRNNASSSRLTPKAATANSTTVRSGVLSSPGSPPTQKLKLPLSSSVASSSSAQASPKAAAAATEEKEAGRSNAPAGSTLAAPSTHLAASRPNSSRHNSSSSLESVTAKSPAASRSVSKRPSVSHPAKSRPESAASQKDE